MRFIYLFFMNENRRRNERLLTIADNKINKLETERGDRKSTVGLS